MTAAAISVYVGVLDDLPTCNLGGTRHDIPTITWDSDLGRVEVSLGNHPDPAGYLAEFAQRLLVLADAAAGVRAVGAGASSC